MRRLRDRPGSGALGDLIVGLGAYGSADLVTRVVRLGVTLLLARRLAPEIVGQAAMALSLFELIRVLERAGAGARIIAVGEAQLAATCNTVRRIYWQWTAVLVVLQVLVAGWLGRSAGQPVAGAMLAVLALVYPCMAHGCVAYHLALRERLTARLATINAAQSIADQILTLVLLLIWPSPWSVVLPKLLVAPLWTVLARRARPWRADPAAGSAPVGEVLRFSAPILASEALATLRTQGDNLIVGATLGSAALGTYFFAFNAGLGIASSLVSAFTQVVFPMLAAQPSGPARLGVLRHVGLAGLVLVMAQVALQALAAPIYVPLVFGPRWAFAAPLIATLCLGGVPLLIAALTSAWLRAEHSTGADAAMSALSCVAALGGLWIGTHSGNLLIAAGGLIAGQTLAALVAAARILWPAIRPSLRAHPLPAGATSGGTDAP